MAFFKTLKYMPRFPQNGFSSIEEAREWVRKFVLWYNYIHLHSELKSITPYQRHSVLDEINALKLMRKLDLYTQRDGLKILEIGNYQVMYH